MSWMDSWSRPSKHATTPPPLYLTTGGEVTPYCHTCGRVVSSRKTQSGNAVVKYCSDRCRHSKPRPLDRKIEATFAALLQGEKIDTVTSSNFEAPKLASKPGRKAVKGDHRILVTCRTVEELMFGPRHDPEKVFGRKKNRATRALAPSDGEWKSVDMEDTDGSQEDKDDESGESQMESQKSATGPMVRPPQTASEVNGSVGGEKGWAERKEETAEELAKRKAGQRRAEEREMVRRAARRACAFGLNVHIKPEATRGEIPNRKSRRDPATNVGDDESNDSDSRRKCEAVMNGAAVEASFAKGEWAIRWRE